MAVWCGVVGFLSCFFAVVVVVWGVFFFYMLPIDKMFSLFKGVTCMWGSFKENDILRSKTETKALQKPKDRGVKTKLCFVCLILKLWVHFRWQ